MIPSTQEHADIRALVASFAEGELLPHAEHVDGGPSFPAERLAQLGELGLLGASVSDRYGGSGGDTLTTAIIVEELATGCPATAVAYGIHALATAGTIDRYGSAEQKERLLPRLASGETLATLAIYEPDSDEGRAALGTLASAGAGGFTLTGEKIQVSSCGEASVLLVGAGTSDGGEAAFVIEDPAANSAVRIEPIGALLGLRGAGLGTVRLAECRLPAGARLGNGTGAAGAAMLHHARGAAALVSAAVSVGVARSACRYAAEYAKKRQAFGGPISRFEALRNFLAEAATLAEAASLLVYRAATTALDDPRRDRVISMAKVHAGEAAYRATKNAVQILGGNGYSREYPVERMFRDAKMLEQLFTATDAQRARIADDVLGDRA